MTLVYQAGTVFCNVLPHAPELPAPIRAYNRRLGICMRCPERPEGCWKSKEYSCARDYQAAARLAARSKDCPLKKLEP